MASDPLYPDLRCNYGGTSIGKGYLSSIITGDHCVTAAIEFGKVGIGAWKNMQLYSFVDYGLAQQQGILLRGERRSQKASSAGAGLRVAFGGRTQLAVEYGMPLSQDFPYQDNDEENIFVNMAVGF